jgi:putative mRNA 3-end processing factor
MRPAVDLHKSFFIAAARLSITLIKADQILHPRPEGLYCPPGDFYIDPVRPVARALITHGHSDHARSGHGDVLATPQTLDIMAIRYGVDFAGQSQAIGYGERLEVGDVTVSFHPAGHVLGSAQIAVEHAGTRIVASGDYARQEDPTSAAFELVPCDVFITEATFGLPVFRHPDPKDEIGRLLQSVRQFPDRTHLVGAYALGKAQRVIRLIRDCGYERPIYLHGALMRLCDYYQGQGIDLGPLEPATVERGNANRFAGEIVMCPPSAFADRWARRFSDPVTCFASGWMRVRQRIKQRGVELPLILSDHSDWDDLIRTLGETGAGEIWITHGREEAIMRWCELAGLKSRPLHLVGYEDEAE